MALLARLKFTTQVTNFFAIQVGRRVKYGFLGILVLICLSTTEGAQASGVFGPHNPPKLGPWFEGWYVRITDLNEHRSFAVITASQLGPNQRFIKGRGTPGYLAIISQNGEGAKTESFESFPDTTFITVDGKDLDFNKMESNDNFLWEVPGQGFIDPNGFDLQIPGKVRAKAQISGRKPWSNDWSNWGPEGYGSFMWFLPIHWFVQSLDSIANYSLEFNRSDGSIEKIESTGSAHYEKNWGKAFPKAWMWMQATNVSEKASIAVAGGILSMGPANVKTYLAGYKSDKVNAEFQIGQMFDMSYSDKIDPCNGRFEIRLQNGAHTMIVKAKADPKSFAPVSIPTEKGYEANGGIESFSTIIEVEIHNNNWIRDFISKDSLIEKTSFKGGALEFGAAYQKCNK